ncbi:MAG: deoxyribose-phosphate aldolase [Treponema sp.]|nr:deoxyribose-phosphate aldolase [Treponema sp.]
MTINEFAAYIDHTLLAPDAGKKQIMQLCLEAKKYGFASVCVNPCYVKYAASELADSDVKVCTVIGFPLGSSTSRIKAAETKDAIRKGADEVDMVINIGAVKDGRFSEVTSDIAAVVKAASKEGEKIGKKIIVKVILETCLLTDAQIVTTCICAQKAGADFVKTSTGFATPKGLDGKLLPNGASEHHVNLMRKTVGNTMKVKASGGIRSVKMAIAMLESGADRIGTSSGVNIIENWDEDYTIMLPKK